MREKRHLWIAALIIAVVVVGGFALSVPRAREISEPPNSTAATSSVPVVGLHDSFAKGVHLITGSLMAPDVCTALTATASVDSAGANIVVALSMPEDTQICLQVPTKLTFSVSAKAPADASVSVSVNGLPAIINRP